MLRMLVGDTGSWLAQFQTLGDRVIEAVESVWPVCLAPLAPIKGLLTHEDPITDQLVSALIRSRRIPGRLVPQHTLLTERANGTAYQSSHIDFVVTIGDDEDVYLACECKRLRVPFKSGKKTLVREYIHEGLMRFVSGQYASGLPMALMLGYVMDANVAAATRGLQRAITIRAKTIGLHTGETSHSTSAHITRFSTRHGCATGCDIQIVHNLLPWP